MYLKCSLPEARNLSVGEGRSPGDIAFLMFVSCLLISGETFPNRKLNDSLSILL